MKAYGSRRIYDTPPQMKAARARVKKEGEIETEAGLEESASAQAPEPDSCDKCGKPAVWHYMPGTSAYCDACVPRGCSCWLDEDGTETLAEDGRQLPCIEYAEHWDFTKEAEWPPTDGLGEDKG